jgi:hypothetical protein
MVNFAPAYFQSLSFVPSSPAVPAMGTALALALVVSGSLAPKAQAACLTTVAENTCATFDASTPSTAVQPLHLPTCKQIAIFNFLCAPMRAFLTPLLIWPGAKMVQVLQISHLSP